METGTRPLNLVCVFFAFFGECVCVCVWEALGQFIQINGELNRALAHTRVNWFERWRPFLEAMDR